MRFIQTYTILSNFNWIFVIILVLFPSFSANIITTEGRNMQKVRSIYLSFRFERDAIKLQADPPLTNVSAIFEFLKSNVPSLPDNFELEYYNSVAGSFESLNLTDDFPVTQAGRLNVVVKYAIHNPATEGSVATTVMCIEGRAFNLKNGKMPFLGGHLTIGDISRDINAADGATGSNTWDSAVVLAAYFEKHPSLVTNKAVLELGAGTGLVGIACAALKAANVYLTDLKYTLPNLETNVALNSDMLPSFTSGQISVRELDWTRKETFMLDQAWDIVVAADVVWLEHLVAPLLKALDAMVTAHTVLYLSHQHRSVACDALLFEGLREMFDCALVSPMELHDGYRSKKIDIYRCVRFSYS